MVKAGGGWPAIFYSWRKTRQAGGIFRLYRALRSRNACKTCALGMGGQKGGMVNERGRFPEVCKKSIQAMTADLQGRIPKNFFDDLSLEKLRHLSSRELESAGRITTPLLAGPLDTHYRPISFDDALERIADKLRTTKPDESFFYFSGRCSNEAGFLMQLVARLYGTNNVNNCSYYCHQASGVGLNSVTGSGTATIVLDDVEHCDLLFVIGCNPASNHPRLMRSIVDLRRRGGKVVVINPLREVGLERFKVPSDLRSLLLGSTVCDLYVQPHIGGDLSLLAAVAKVIVERGVIDQGFIDEATEGWDDFRASLETLEWPELERRSGVNRATIERIADIYAASSRSIFCWAMGVTHHEHGVGNVRMIANLAMIRGMLGRPHCGLLPLRGHSNVQGIGSMGVVPKLKDAVLERLHSHFGVEVPKRAGLDTASSIESADEGKVRFASCLGGNLFGSNPDSVFASRALGKIDLVLYFSTTLNTGHVFGRGRETIILPVLARDEEPQATTQESMFNYVRLSDGGAARHEGPRSEVQLIADIAERVLGDGSPIDFGLLRDHGRIRDAIARIIPGYDKLEAIGTTREEFQISGRTFHTPRFPTPSGRAVFHPVEPPPLANGVGQLRLMTIRSEGQFNTVVYEEEDLYRGQRGRDVILLHMDDLELLGLRVDQRVTVTSAVGSISGQRVRPIAIRPGNAAMYYPEANILVPRNTDPLSGTPSFKNTLISISPDPPAR